MKALALPLLLATLLSGPTLAQQRADDHAGHAAATGGSAAAVDLTDGEVRRIDKGTGTLTLKHGDIRNLDMPGMTMVFKVKEPALLDTLKVGDKVKFRVEHLAGAYVVTLIEPVR